MKPSSGDTSSAFYFQKTKESPMSFTAMLDKISNKNYKKTVSYHQHIFRPPILLKMLFKSVKAGFFQKILFRRQIFYFLQKTFTIKAEKTFLRNNIILCRILQQIFHLHRFDFEKIKFFVTKKRKFRIYSGHDSLWARVLCSLAAEDACFRMRVTLGVILIRSLVSHVCVPECYQNGFAMRPYLLVQ